MVKYAHFPGEGPKGEHCSTCRHFTPVKRPGATLVWKSICGKAAAMTGTPPGKVAACPPTTAACKYWEKPE